MFGANSELILSPPDSITQVDSINTLFKLSDDSIIIDKVRVLSKSNSLIEVSNIKLNFRINDCKIDSINTEFGSKFKLSIIEPLLKKAIRYSVREFENPTKEGVFFHLINEESIIAELHKRYFLFISLEFDILDKNIHLKK
ncbi:MAG: hypothetical protein CMP61_05220 [Flavobacteriales bacterium]|nr:hypothetical protein [Flavobacteriales bacterium]|tara:strand:- start:5072 stop:5494 length:423 start_codon:yes stop_codon:yes gene_type:complete